MQALFGIIDVNNPWHHGNSLQLRKKQRQQAVAYHPSNETRRFAFLRQRLSGKIPQLQTSERNSG